MVSLPREISNEQAVTFVAAAAGLGGFAGQVIAAERLSRRQEETIPIRDILFPAGIAGATAVASAFLIPVDNQPQGVEETQRRVKMSR